MNKRSKVSVALSAIAIFGVGVTAALAAKGAKKKEPSIKNYIPAIVSGTATAACIVGAQTLSLSEIAAITAAGSAIAVKYEDLKNYISDKYPEVYKEANNYVNERVARRQIEADPTKKEETYDGKTRYFFPFLDQIVYMKPDDVVKVQGFILARLGSKGVCSANEVADYIHQDLGYKDVHLIKKDKFWELIPYGDREVTEYDFPILMPDFEDILDDNGELVPCKVMAPSIEPMDSNLNGYS